jgi:uncharacterized membrane protein
MTPENRSRNMSFPFAANEFKVASKARKLSNIRQDVDRTFQLPTRLYVATVGFYFAFIAVMAIGFRTGEMGLVIAICVFYIAMAFGVPSLWARMNPRHDSQAVDWASFQRNGIVTMTGHMKAADATAQVLVLPVLVFFWGAATATLAALAS